MFEQAGENWKKSLTFLWICQFFFQSSFAFGLPFAPFLMQNIGVTPDDLPFWVGLFGGAPAITTLMFSPFWGWMADRFGRKKMLLRCYLGGAFVLSGIAFCYTPQSIILLRLIQGSVCGSISVALAMASSLAPKGKTGFALGVVNSATFSGVLFGSLFGGIAADTLGCRYAFLLSGMPSVVAAILLLFFIHEAKIVPIIGNAGQSLLRSCLTRTIPHGKTFHYIAPILLLMGIVMFGRLFDSSFLPLFVQELLGERNGAAIWTGIVLSLSGVAGIFSGIAAGYLSDKYSPQTSALCIAIVAMVLAGCLYFTPGILFFAVMRPLANMAIDGIEPSLQVWLCKRTRPSYRNLAFAWSASVRSMWWFCSPISAGFVVRHFGLRQMYIAECAVFLVIVLLILLFKNPGRRKGNRAKSL